MLRIAFVLLIVPSVLAWAPSGDYWLSQVEFERPAAYLPWEPVAEFEDSPATNGPESLTWACCYWNGDWVCADLQDWNCLQLNGSWYEGDHCPIDNCPPRGACCTSGWECSYVPRELCNGPADHWIGGSCSTGLCPSLLGACCVDGYCSRVYADQCAASDGTWYGIGSDCDDTPCKYACCYDDTCADLAWLDCVAHGGVFHALIPCESEPCLGACCSGSGCHQDDGPSCAAQGGTFHVNRDCEDIECIGACCYGDACTTETQAGCAAKGGGLGGTFFVNQGCGQVQCPGVCCTPSGCQMKSNETLCAQVGGVWKGRIPGGCNGPYAGACNGLCDTTLIEACCYGDCSEMRCYEAEAMQMGIGKCYWAKCILPGNACSITTCCECEAKGGECYPIGNGCN